jgi:phosphoheptose isomerase
MAGRRRTSGRRAEDGTVRPTAAAARAERINTKMLGRYAEAQSELERLAVALDYVRAAARSTARTEPGRTDQVVSGLVRALLRGGDELLQIKVGAR